MKTTFQSLLLATLSVAFIVACQKKNNDSGMQQPPIQTCIMGQMQPNGYMCMNGQLIMNPAGAGSLLNNAEFSTSYMSGMVSLNAMGNMMGNNMDLGNPQAIYYYSGQVTVTGTVQVLSNSLCGAPMGGYSVQGTGNIYAGSLSNMNLTVMGPANMNLTGSAYVYNPNGLQRDGAGNRLGIMNAMLTVNGVPCGSVTTY